MPRGDPRSRAAARLRLRRSHRRGPYALARQHGRPRHPDRPGADVAIMNNGGIRADLPEGVITWGNVYQVQPFQNRLQRLTVTGAVLLDALEHCVAGRDHFPDCHVAGVQVWYDAGTAPGKRISRTRLENGKSIDKDRTYTLVVSDFMTTGGSGFRMLAAAPQEDLDVVDTDAFIRYLGGLAGPVEAPADGRFHRTDRGRGVFLTTK